MKHFIFRKTYLFFIFVITVGLTGCSEEMQESLRPFPTSIGGINQLVVIADEDIWEGPIGDTIRFYYSTAYPILPQPEPILDLNHFTAEQLQADPMRRELRNYMIVANLGDADSPTTRLITRDIGEEKVRRAKEDPEFNSLAGKDKWARNQLLIYQFAESEKALVENLKKNFPAALKRINQADAAKIEATVYQDGESFRLEEEVQEKMGIELRIPNDYQLAISDDDVIWMRKETPILSSNILLYKTPYSDRSQLSKEGIKAIRDTLGRKYISSTLPDTYMKVNDVDLPLLVSEKTMDGKYTLEARGIWEIENDFMGGAFISYLILDQEKNELIFLDGFVHAPGEDKRNFMQYLQHILNTVKT